MLCDVKHLSEKRRKSPKSSIEFFPHSFQLYFHEKKSTCAFLRKTVSPSVNWKQAANNIRVVPLYRSLHLPAIQKIAPLPSKYIAVNLFIRRGSVARVSANRPMVSASISSHQPCPCQAGNTKETESNFLHLPREYQWRISTSNMQACFDHPRVIRMRIARNYVISRA